MVLRPGRNFTPKVPREKEGSNIISSTRRTGITEGALTAPRHCASSQSVLPTAQGQPAPSSRGSPWISSSRRLKAALPARDSGRSGPCTGYSTAGCADRWLQGAGLTAGRNMREPGQDADPHRGLPDLPPPWKSPALQPGFWICPRAGPTLGARALFVPGKTYLLSDFPLNGANAHTF